jgi:hypothetical protein
MDTVILKLYGPKKFKIQKHDWFSPVVTRRYYKDLDPLEINQPANRTWFP